MRSGSTSQSPAVEIAGLVKRYGDKSAVDGLDLTVAAGSVTAVLGPNGAGKTTTVETCEGYRRADAGSVRVLGLDPATEGAALRPRIGVMLQSGGVYPGARTRISSRRNTPNRPARCWATAPCWHPS